MSNKPEIGELKARRASVKGRLTSFANYLDLIKAVPDLSSQQLKEFQLKFNKIQELTKQYDSLQDQIDVLVSSDEDKLKLEFQERDEIESRFATLIASAQLLLDEHPDPKNNENSRSSSNYSSVGFKLPNIQITKFDGNTTKWLEFRDTFKSLIHDNKQLQEVHKFHYLISYLEGEAARVAANLEISADNYSKVWQLLIDRYDNKRQLINNHLNSLFNIESIYRESEKSLRSLVDNVNKDLRALASLGEPTDKWDTLIIHMIVMKLDGNTTMKWEEHRNNTMEATAMPSLQQFLSFIKSRADMLETYHQSKLQQSTSKNTSSSSSNNASARYGKYNYNKSLSFTMQEGGNKKGGAPRWGCNFCNGNHSIYNCPPFLARSPEQRLVDVSQLKLCLNCLRKGHNAKDCQIGPCRECKKKHNSLLHTSAPASPPSRMSAALATGAPPPPAGEPPQRAASDAPHPDVAVNLSAETRPTSVNQVMLATAQIKVTNPITKVSETVRCLLDSGSQASFMTETLKERLGLESLPTPQIQVLGIGNMPSHVIRERCVARLESLQTDFNVTLAFSVLPELTSNIPKTSIDLRLFKLPSNIKLADPSFNLSAPIQVLIGADLFWHIMGREQIASKPFLRSSQLGWVISGPIMANCTTSVANSEYQDNKVASFFVSNDQLDNNMSKFWELEELPRKSLLSDAEKECELHFQTHTTRQEDGRFNVRLPLKDTPDRLGDSFHRARNQFLSLEKRFRKNPKLKQAYCEFISEYIALGHCSPARAARPEPGYFLCHHAVLRDASESTKLRVVFNASAATTSGVSLNDLQMVGPQVQDSLFSILLRFRQHKLVLTGDIEKMYRQIMVHEEDRDLQLILWREDETLPLRTLRLNTVTYGFASASYLSTKCLWTLGEQCPDNEIKTIIQNDLCCDDLITGAESIQELLNILNNVKATLKAGGFNLRKLRSNVPNLFQSANIDLTGNLSLRESSSALGMGWEPKTDSLQFSIECLSVSPSSITKRSILSTSFRIFDPLGLLSPTTVLPKMLMQQLWLRKLDWDEDVPQDLKKDWLRIQSNLSSLSAVEIPRRVLCDNPVSTELHSFCDASKQAYGACVYLRSTDERGFVCVKLLCAKSRVAPTKPILTIPKLELLGALLASNLCKVVLDALRCPISRCVHWSDSSVVLAWLNSSPSRLKPFVANKVVEVCENTKLSSWRHVPTAANPADFISRGVSADKLQSLDVWWGGPPFLLKDESQWPVPAEKQHLPEVEVHTAVEYLSEIEVLLTDPVDDSFVKFERFSKFTRIKRAFAFVFRFVHNLRNPQSKRIGSLSVEELENSFLFLAKQSQMQSFPREFQALTRKRDIPVKSNILSLSPFLDETGVMRVGGRLDSSSYAYCKKHPVILASSHRLTELLFAHEHARHLHAGPALLLGAVREAVWPVAGRVLARRTVRRCVACRRLAPRTLAPLMGNLPPQRVMPSFPFHSVGMDFAGPFNILNKKGRGARTSKCYLCLFICFRYKCVHLEAVSELSKEAFILALRRFISRRGKPKEIFSDNGRNFVAAAKDIGKLIKDNLAQLSDFAANEQIKFNFHPAYAPHFSGLAEAGIKSAKHHIKRVMGNTNLTFEELATLFSQIESVLNSRPLSPLSSSPHDFLPLTPGHFLIGRPLTSLPSPPIEDNKSNLSRYANLEKLRQTFWNRWQREYISELQQRTKWKLNTALEI